MSKDLLDESWREAARHAPRLWLGFSGGLDSTVLLHLLVQHQDLQSKLSVIHFNHGLSPNAALWEEHCKQIALKFNVPFVAHSLVLPTSNIEACARKERLRVLQDIINPAEMVLVAHHAADQAETLLLNLCRGTYIDGSAAMPIIKKFGVGTMCRPLLQQSKDSIYQYACRHGLSWVEDESNRDEAFSRNYLRLEVMPRLLHRWPSIYARFMAHTLNMQAVKHNLDALAIIDGVVAGPILSLETILPLTLERQQNAVRYWLLTNNATCPSSARMKAIVLTVIHAKIDATPRVAIGSFIIMRYQQELHLLSNTLAHNKNTYWIEWSNFPLPIMLGMHQLQARLTQQDGMYLPPGSVVTISFRQGGEVLVLHGKTKKLKKLWQTWGVPTWLRNNIPLIYINNTLAAVVGYAIGDNYYKTSGDYIYCLSYE